MPIANQLHPYNIWSRNIFPVSMEGCVAYVPFWQEDMQGSTLISYDQYHHSCTITNALWSNQGRILDGTGDYITIPDHANLSALSTLTIGIWMKSNDTTNEVQDFISKYTSPGQREFDVYCNPSTKAFTAAVYDESANAYIASINAAGINIWDNAWHYVDITFDGATVKVYKDLVDDSGTPSTSGTYVATENLTADVTIGHNGTNSTQDFKGTIGEVWIYNRVLPVGERTNLRSATKRPYIT